VLFAGLTAVHEHANEFARASMGNNDSDTRRAGSPVATNQIVQCAGWATHFFLKVINPRLRINLMKSKIANILGGDTRVGDSHTAIRAPQLSRWN